MRSLFQLIVLSIWLIFPAPGYGADSMLVLQQRHRIYSTVTAYISKTAVKVVPYHSDYVFLCSAPSWEAVIYSDKRKLICRLPFSKWSRQGIRTALNIESNDNIFHYPKVFQRKEVYAGLASQVYGFPAKKDDLGAGEVGYYWLYEEFPVQKNVELFIEALYDVPKTAGLPMRLRRLQSQSFGFGLKYNKDVNVMSFLETLSSKVIPDNNAVFAAPKVGYKVVPESEIVIETNDATKAFGDMMNDK